MYWCLLGVLVVIIGFAIKLEPIAIIVVSARYSNFWRNQRHRPAGNGRNYLCCKPKSADHDHPDDSDRHTGEKRSEGSRC